MKPYNPKARCPKCGYDQIRTSYCEGGEYINDHWKELRQHLNRYCQRCGWEWPERCLTKKELGNLPIEVFPELTLRFDPKPEEHLGIAKWGDYL